MSDNCEKSPREALLEALTIMKGGISYLYPHNEAKVLRAWADALMAIENEEELRNGYRQLYASFSKGPSSLEDHMLRAQWVFLCLYTGRLSKEA